MSPGEDLSREKYSICIIEKLLKKGTYKSNGSICFSVLCNSIHKEKKKNFQERGKRMIFEEF